MQKVNITDKFLALIGREELVSFNDLSKDEKVILELYNRFNIENSTDFYEIVSFYIELKLKDNFSYKIAKKNILKEINDLCRERNLELFVS